MELPVSAGTSADLRITAVELYTFDLPLRTPFHISIGTMSAADNVLVRIHTDSGLAGIGEACPFPAISGETQESTIVAARALREIVLGRNPLEIEALGSDFGDWIRKNPSATAAFDTALHDLLGKVAGLPLYRLLGGDRRAFLSAITVGLEGAEVMATRAAEFVREGYRRIKIKVGENAERDLERVRGIRMAVGEDVELQIDANQGWTTEEAITVLRRMQELRILFVEQPVKASDIHGLKAVKEASPIPVMADESAFNPEDAIRLAQAGACDSLNIKLMKAGSIGNMLRMTHIAEAAGLPCMVGCMLESRLGLTAAAHVVGARSIVRWADLDGHSSHILDPVLGGMTFDRGRIRLPESPGIGADVDPRFLGEMRLL